MKTTYKIAGILILCSGIALVAIYKNALTNEVKASQPIVNSFTLADKQDVDNHSLEQIHPEKENKETLPAVENIASNKVYVSPQLSGNIGLFGEDKMDNPVDNVFHILLPEKPSANKVVWLEYELDGVADFASVSRSINDELATGGYFVQKSEGWKEQRERLNPAVLKQGDNIIRFSVPADAKYGYRVRNVRIREENAAQTARQLILNQPSGSCYFGQEAYTQGFITGKDASKAIIRINGKEAGTFNGLFEELIEKPDSKATQWTALVEAVYPDGEKLTATLHFDTPSTFDYRNDLKREFLFTQIDAKRKSPFTIDLENTKLTATEGSVKATTPISITSLRDVDYASLDAGMINVSAGADGYRFLPHGTVFDREVQLEMKYDTLLIPEGYTPEDIRTYFFDENTHRWVALPRDTVLQVAQTVVSRTTHFTLHRYD